MIFVNLLTTDMQRAYLSLLRNKSNIQKVKDINKQIEGIEEELEKFSGYEKISNETISDLRSLENKKNGTYSGFRSMATDNEKPYF